MIKIFNKKLNCKILIDEKVDFIQFTPKDYEEKPHLIIEIRNFDFFHHTYTCVDCKKFNDAIGENSLDWFISYDDKYQRLDMGGKKNNYPTTYIKFKMTDHITTSILCLAFHDYPTDRDELKSILDQMVLEENYEDACIIRDLLKSSNKI